MSSALVARADQVGILAPRFLLDRPLQAFGAPACSVRVSDPRPAHHAPADPWLGPDGVGVVVLLVHGATVKGVIRGWWVSLKPPRSACTSSERIYAVGMKRSNSPELVQSP